MTADPIHPAGAVATPTPSAGRTAIALGGFGAVLQVLGGLLETYDRVPAGEPGFVARTTVIGAAYLLLVATVLALARSRAAGHSAVARYALVVAAAGWALSAVAQLVLRVDVDLAEQVLFPIATVAIGTGMAAAGVAVLRTRRWRGWRRWVPLACGAYPFAIIFPAFAAAGEPNFLVLSGWGLSWLILTAALWSAPQD
jgi:hypothetical protein